MFISISINLKTDLKFIAYIIGALALPASEKIVLIKRPLLTNSQYHLREKNRLDHQHISHPVELEKGNFPVCFEMKNIAILNENDREVKVI